MRKNPIKKSYKIIDLIKIVQGNKFVLPEIQREFVWDLDRIAELWDSIYHGYPIGQLLFWTGASEIPTYNFFDDNTEDRFLFIAKRPHWTHKARQDSANKITVLDGQQRLTSLFLGTLENGVTTKTRSNSTPEKHYLCIYIGDKDEDDDNEIKLFDWRKDAETDEYISIHKALTSRKQNHHIRHLKEQLRSTSNSIPVDYVPSNNLIEVIEIFRRLNNNGRNMNKSELFLAMWFGNGRAKDLKSDLIDLREAFGKNFDVKDNTITQLLITIFGPQGENLNNTSYSTEMFANITNNLSRLKQAILATVNFLHQDCGIYSNSEMVSHSLFIPLVHTFYKFNCQLSPQLRAELRCFTYRALVFDLFTRSTNTTLARLKKSVDNLTNDHFIANLDDHTKETCFYDYANHKSQWLDGEIDHLLETTKGTKTNLLLLLLRQAPANIDREMFDQDHLVAADLFDRTTANALKEDRRQKFGIRIDGQIIPERKLTNDELHAWNRISRQNYHKKDTLPNLWLLESTRNRQKGKKLLNIWYTEQTPADQKDFWESTFIPEYDADYLKITNFEQLYNNRKDNLFNALYELLELPKIS